MSGCWSDLTIFLLEVNYSPKGNDNSAGGEALGCHAGGKSSP